MIKFLIIVLGIGWLLIQLIKFFLRSKLKKFFDQVQQVQREEVRKSRPKPANGNVNVDFVPKEHQERKATRFDKGDYIDYVEVKD